MTIHNTVAECSTTLARTPWASAAALRDLSTDQLRDAYDAAVVLAGLRSRQGDTGRVPAKGPLAEELAHRAALSVHALERAADAAEACEGGEEVARAITAQLLRRAAEEVAYFTESAQRAQAEALAEAVASGLVETLVCSCQLDAEANGQHLDDCSLQSA